MRRLTTIGVASGLGANVAGSEQGPVLLMQSKKFQQSLQDYGIDPQWVLIYPEAGVDRLEALTGLLRNTAKQLREVVSAGDQFVTIGGDHSIAMGVWQGVASALQPKGLGLIWIDAHLDLHTMETSVSCNVHGMPLAALLGQGDELLQKIYGDGPCLNPANVSLVGAHSYEPEEIGLARRMVLATFDMQAIRKSGSLTSVMQQAMKLAADSCDRFGVSIDLDVLDPMDAPGVNTPEPGGIGWQELRHALSIFRNNSRLVGIEIAEFNPAMDQEQRTQKIIAGLIGAIYGDSQSNLSQ